MKPQFFDETDLTIAMSFFNLVGFSRNPIYTTTMVILTFLVLPVTLTIILIRYLIRLWLNRDNTN